MYDVDHSIGMLSELLNDKTKIYFFLFSAYFFLNVHVHKI